MKTVIAALCALACLTGCAPTTVFHSAFDDITHDTRASVNDLVTYRQLITLNGLMPLHVPGMVFLEPDAEAMGGKYSPALLVGVSPKRSMVVEARYSAKNHRKDVAKAQASYQLLLHQLRCAMQGHDQGGRGSHIGLGFFRLASCTQVLTQRSAPPRSERIDLPSPDPVGL